VAATRQAEYNAAPSSVVWFSVSRVRQVKHVLLCTKGKGKVAPVL